MLTNPSVLIVMLLLVSDLSCHIPKQHHALPWRQAVYEAVQAALPESVRGEGLVPLILYEPELSVDGGEVGYKYTGFNSHDAARRYYSGFISNKEGDVAVYASEIVSSGPTQCGVYIRIVTSCSQTALNYVLSLEGTWAVKSSMLLYSAP